MIARTLPRIRPEHRLPYLASFFYGAQPPDRLEETVRGVRDWDLALESSERHRLLPRVCAMLRSGPPIEPRAAGLVEAAQRAGEAKRRLYRTELERLLDAFARSGVESMLLKGAALLETVYRDRHWRSFRDGDLLIRPACVKPAVETLASLGYQPSMPEPHVPSRWHLRRLGRMGYRNSIPWFHPGLKVWIDMHVEPFDRDFSPFTLPAGWLWERPRPHRLGRAPALLPDPERLFTHLLFHLVKHRTLIQGAALGWYSDLRDLLAHEPGIDGRFCAQLLSDNRDVPRIAGPLAFIRDQWAAPLPAPLAAAAAGTRADTIDRLLEPASDLRRFERSHDEHADRKFWEYWGMMRGAPDRVWFLVRWLVPDRQYIAFKYRCSGAAGTAAGYARHAAAMAAKAAMLGLSLAKPTRLWNNEAR